MEITRAGAVDRDRARIRPQGNRALHERHGIDRPLERAIAVGASQNRRNHDAAEAVAHEVNSGGTPGSRGRW